jgi:uncharacterized protein (DUF4415 family)
VRRGRGRPAGSGSKVQLTVRFDREVVDALKAGGRGWQTRMNDPLRAAIPERAASVRPATVTRRPATGARKR